MSEQIVLKKIENNIGIITLNNPKKCNVINPALIYLFQEHFHELINNKKVHTIIIHGKGKHFCGGADLRHMHKMATASETENKRDALWFSQLFELIHNSEKPTICCVHGHIYGGGIGILAACDIVVSDSGAKFCFPEVKIGLVPATIGLFVTQRIGYQHAKHLMLTAEVFDTETAKDIGLINRISLEDNVLDAGLKIANQLIKNDKHALIETKAWLNKIQPINSNLLFDAANLLAEIRATDSTTARIETFLDKK